MLSTKTPQRLSSAKTLFQAQYFQALARINPADRKNMS